MSYTVSQLCTVQSRDVLKTVRAGGLLGRQAIFMTAVSKWKAASGRANLTYDFNLGSAETSSLSNKIFKSHLWLNVAFLCGIKASTPTTSNHHGCMVYMTRNCQAGLSCSTLQAWQSHFPVHLRLGGLQCIVKGPPQRLYCSLGSREKGFEKAFACVNQPSCKPYLIHTHCYR